MSAAHLRALRSSQLRPLLRQAAAKWNSRNLMQELTVELRISLTIRITRSGSESAAPISVV